MIRAIKAKILKWVQYEVNCQMEAMEARISRSLKEKLEADLSILPHQERSKVKAELVAWLESERTARLMQEGACLAESTKLSSRARIENKVGREAIKVGENTFLSGRLLTYGHGGKITIGDWCYVGDRTEIWSMNSVSIGNRVLISHDVNIHDGAAHSLDAKERHEHFKHILTKGHPRKAEDVPGVPSAPIVIEDDVWISFGVSILRGVRIGKGSVIAACSIVTKDVPPGVVYQCRIQPVTKPLYEVVQSSKSNIVSEELLEDPVS